MLSDSVSGALSDADTVGPRLRALRKERKLSLRALAAKSGLSVNTLSLIEHGKTSPGVHTLQQIADQLRCPVGIFFEERRENNHIALQRSGERRRLAFRYGTMEDLGAGIPRMGAEPLIFTMDPNTDSGQTPCVHTGREFVYCLEGHILYFINDEPYTLGPGDSLLFDAYLPHRWRNEDDTSSSALFVLCPMDTRDCPAERHFLSKE
jgi:transcriptional regulator with XRE-family HTH domain